MQTVCIRLHSGDLLRESILAIASSNNIKAGIILTCVGSLSQANIRLAGGDNIFKRKDSFEILSLTGTFNAETQAHFHISLADNTAKSFGGHLLDNNIVASTVELVLGIIPNTEFTREKDPSTGYLELIIKDDILR